MPELFNSETGWLNVTNALLGFAVILCLFAVCRAVIQEMREWAAKRSQMLLDRDDHAFNLESLGITMADGGEPVNELTGRFHRPSVHPDDPPNIIRSDN